MKLTKDTIIAGILRVRGEFIPDVEKVKKIKKAKLLKEKDGLPKQTKLSAKA